MFEVDKNHAYDENSIITLGYRDAVRSSIGMYIGNAEIDGMHHLLTEIIANAMDEAAAGYGKVIKVIKLVYFSIFIIYNINYNYRRIMYGNF